MRRDYETHKRIVTQLVEPLAATSGLTEVFFAVFWFFYYFFGSPFRDLQLGLSYSQLLSKIDGSESTNLTVKFNSQINFWCYLKLFF